MKEPFAPDVYNTALKAALIEMWAEEHEGGLTDLVLRQSIAMGPHSNGFHPQITLPRELAAPAIEIEEGTPLRRKYEKKLGKAGRKAGMRSQDVMNTAGWKNDILTFAAAHDGHFEFKAFKNEAYKPEEHGGVPFSKSKAHPILSQLFKLGWLDRIQIGHYKVTDRGRSEFAKYSAARPIVPKADIPSEEVRDGEQIEVDEANTEEASSWKPAFPVKQPVKQPPARPSITDDAMSSEQWRRVILSFALAHKGVFDYERFKPIYRPEDHNGVSFSQSRIHMVISEMLRVKKWVTRDYKGYYRLTKLGQREAEAQSKSKPLAKAARI